MPWHRSRWASLALRLCGALLLSVTFACARRLFATPIPAPATRETLLALTFFVTLSAGSALLTLGAHLFDPIEISPRWQRRL